MTVLEEAEQIAKENFNSNFRMDKLDWATQVWIRLISTVMERRLKELEKELKERIII